ncbi:hypothetical protein HER10_EVM0012338 [Colletotrichum scovillei]|uniref:Integral membrane protein n=1 Tax=Colletotrichum scovillei TaxID=1209932 RepID=A0A9P7QPI5_9PEZI|nr:uncharacterized protein HER10_EVM0012338 [Colletotrichum scovillei]KAF4775595.1 hypothetical protein HER10_EVM0012338 [Colletotrichum scovillei]KAG7038014.1 integral membrane protein [Colletotrichum scovillei]KAG7040354.1 integral membrane protein [Colletotrichum scovillei]KAG7060403.1 integral membrane protein [Colletotrichum scovillei]
MKLILLGFRILAAIAVLVGAESIFDTNATAIVQWLITTPTCSMPCFSEVLSSGRCQLSGLAKCACTNDDLQLRVSTCVQLSCDFTDQVNALRKSQVLCYEYPTTSRRGSAPIFALALPIITLIIVLLRCFASWTIARKLWLDDYVTLVALGLLIISSVCGAIANSLGFGKHYWAVNPDSAKTLLQVFYALQIMYNLVIITAKIAICCFYRRIFPNRWLQVATKAAIILIVVHGLIFFFLIVFQCIPLAMIWNKSVKGRCLNITAIGYTAAIIGIMEDIVLLIMPIPILLQLQLGLKKKLGLVFMFSLGSFGCITSIVRLKYLVSFANTFDPTWDNTDIISWSSVEVNVAIVCGSLPLLRPVFKYLSNPFKAVKVSSSESIYSLQRRRGLNSPEV